MYGIAGSTVVVLVMVASTTVERRWGRVYDGSNRSGGYGGGGRQVEGLGWRWGPWEFAVHGNGSDAGRSRLTFRPLARCSRGAFINSSVLIPRIDEWPPIAIPCAPYSAALSSPLGSRINSTSRRILTQFPL